MKKPRFEVTANCSNCGGFKSLRNKATYMSTDGHEHTIENVVCPTCRMHAPILKIKTVA